jgi:hypothetical protein
MLLKPQRQSNRAQHSVTKTLPAPIGGWNARDPLAAMPPTDAIILDNWFPRTADLISRGGYTNFTTGLPNQVNTLMVYNGTTSATMFAASGSGIYDVTAGGAVGAAAVTGLTNSKFQYVNIATSGGKFLWAVNGADLAQMYNGSTWSNPSVTGLGSLTTADFIHANVWKERIFLVQKNSMSVWYLGLKSVSGAASEINFGSLFKKGGRIVATATWTVDGGYGMDDHLVIVTSRGEVAVYHGTDPSNASTFALAGVYELGAPIGTRCFTKYGGELILITLDGFEPLSKALASTRTDNRIAISDKISGQVTQSTTDYQSNFGWEATLFPTQNMLIFNVPVNPGVESHQYVMNTLTGAWCRFKGWNANCFAVMDDVLYFGMNGVVCKAWQGNSDAGANINTDAKPAFNYFDAEGRLKQWKMARPVFSANANPSPGIGLNTDFDDTDSTQTTTFTGTVALWDGAMWDVSSFSGQQIYKDWQTISGYGFCAALRLKFSSNVLDVRWSSIDYVYEYGGVI